MPSKVLKFKTPLQVLGTHVSLPSVLMLTPRVFGCVVFVHLHKTQRTKLDPCAIRCVFLGYGLHKKGYRCLDPLSNRIYVSLDVTFLESEPFFPTTVSRSPLQGESPVADSGAELTRWFPVSSTVGVDAAPENEKLGPTTVESDSVDIAPEIEKLGEE